MREKRDFISGGRFASCGAMIEGRLKDAKIVMLSLTAKRAKESLGTTAAGEAEGAPNILAKHESLYMDRLMLTDDVARNLVPPAETFEAGFAVTVERKVSTVLAVA